MTKKELDHRRSVMEWEMLEGASVAMLRLNGTKEEKDAHMISTEYLNPRPIERIVFDVMPPRDID